MLRELSVAAVIVSVCMLLHVAGVVLMARWALSRRRQFEQSAGLWRFVVLLIILFSMFMILHVTETGIWALFYYSRNLFDDFETCLYFSMGSYTTIGYGDVVLAQRWRLLGAVEGISGVLLCGLSTAVIFTALNAMIQMRILKR